MIAKGMFLAALASATAAIDMGPAWSRAPDVLSSVARVKQEHRYRLSAAIRPLLFWVGAKNVGGARIVWREGDEGRRGYELLLGSDPPPGLRDASIGGASYARTQTPSARPCWA